MELPDPGPEDAGVAEASEPVEPAEPAEPAEASESAGPAGPAEPAEPAEASEPAKPAESKPSLENVATFATQVAPAAELDITAAGTMIASPGDEATDPGAGADAAEQLNAATAALIGKEIDGRYRIIRLLGEGGMGAVYVAEHLKLHKEVAFKTIRAEFLGHQDIMGRFEREAMVTAQLEHPHIVSAIDYGHLPDEGGAYLVIQLVRGESLDEVLNRGAMPWPVACDVCSQIADAMTVAHARGIVHRDLKPDNVLIETRDDGKYMAHVLDFGIARIVEGDGPDNSQKGSLTRVGTVIGTPGYMSPEQAMGAEVDVRTDIYALGVILWECIAGRRLWQADDLTSLFSMQLTEVPPPIKTIARSVPDELSKLIAGMLARQTEDRLDKAAEIRTTLKRLSIAGGSLAGVSSLAVATPAGERGAGLRTLAESLRTGAESLRTHADPVLATVRSTTRDAVEELREGKPGRKSLYVGIGALLLLLFAVCVVTRLGGGGDEEAKPDAAVATGEAGASEEGEGEPASDSKQPEKKPKKSEPEPSPELAAQIETMFENKSRTKRKKAAKAILEDFKEEEVPSWARLSAQLESRRKCADKDEIILEMAELGDGRVTPVLYRLYKYPKNKCGNVFNKTDCFGCLRTNLERTLKALDPEFGKDDGKKKKKKSKSKSG